MNPTKNGIKTPPFQVSRNQWLKAKREHDNSKKRIKSKIKVIIARQKRLENVQRTIQSDISRLRSEITELEHFIDLRADEMQQAESLMLASLGGSL